MGKYIQKFLGVLLLLSILSIINGNAQTIKLINNPDKSKGITQFDGFTIYNNKLFITYITLSDNARLAFYDGSKIDTIPIPKGYGNSTSMNFWYAPPSIYNDKFYFTTNSSGTHVAELNADTIRILDNPTNTGKGYYGGFKVFNKKMYYLYQEFNSFQLAEYNGYNTKIIQAPSGSGISGSNFQEFKNKLYVNLKSSGLTSDIYNIGFFDGDKLFKIDNLNKSDLGALSDIYSFNNKIYFSYYVSPFRQLAESDGMTFKTYANPINGDSYDGSPIVFKGKLYFRYRSSILTAKSENKFQFATLDSSGIKLFPNPDDGIGVNSQQMGPGICWPIIFNDAIYFQYNNIYGNNQLAKFDGSKITLLENPVDFLQYNGRPIIYNNNLLLSYKSKSGINSLVKFDGNTFIIIANPDLGTIPSNLACFTPIIYNNALYFQYTNSKGVNQIASYSDSNSLAAPTVGNFYNVNRICDGDSVKLVGGIFPINYSYVWYLNEQEIPNVIGPTIYAKEGGYYSVSYKYANGQISLRSEPYKISKDTLPLAPIISSNDSLAKCPTSPPITLKSNYKSGISWYWEGSLLKATTDSTLVTNNKGTYYAKLSNGTCNSLNSNSLIIRTRSNPQKPFFTTTKYSFCSGDSISLTLANINKGDSIRWYYGAKSDITNILTKVFNDTTKLYVTRTDSLKCSITSDTVTLTKTPLPSAPNLTRDSSSYLVASAKGIIWYKNGTVLNDTAQKIKPTTPGSYTARTSQNGCASALSNPYYYLVTDVINLSADEFIKLAPNPFINQLNFDFVVKGYQRLNIEVFDIANGSKKASMQNLTPGMPIYLGQLSGGTYIIKVSSNDGKINYQFKMVKL